MSVPKIIGCRPVASQILVEMLTDNEMLGTNMILPGGKSSINEVPQAIVLDCGPSFDSEAWGYGKGDRVMVVGKYNPVPKVREDQEREMGIIEPSAVRAVLLQADEV